MAENKKAVNNKNLKGQPPADKSPNTGSKALSAGRSERRTPRRSGEPIKNAIPAAPQSAKFIHQLLPYLLLMLALFIAVSYIFVAADAGGSVGVLGGFMNNIFCGLFGWPAYLLPLVLLNLAVFWRKYIDMELTGLKISLSFLIMLAVSALVHVVTINETGSIGFNIGDLWYNGIVLRGGGVFGGLAGEICFKALGIVGSMIILIPLIFILLMFLFGTTPRGMGLYIGRKLRDWAERQKKAREEAEAKFAASASSTANGADTSEKDGDKTSESAAMMGGADGIKLSRRELKKLRKAEKKKQKEMLRRHEALSGADAVPHDAVFTEGHKPVMGNSGAAQSENQKTSDNISGTIAGAAAEKPGGNGDAGKNMPADESRYAGGAIPLGAAEDKNSDKGKKDGKTTEVLEPVRSGGISALTEQLLHDEDYNDLNELLKDNHNTAQKAADAASGGNGKDKNKDNDNIDMGLIVNTEDISDLIESDDIPPTTDGKQLTTYMFPPFDLLAADTNPKEADYSEELKENAKKLMDTLASFNVRIKEINYSRGPTITRYELKPDAGVRVRSIANLVDDIALSLATSGVRIEAPIPGKAAVGVEVPNRSQATVYLRTLIESPTFAETASRLAVCLGMDVAGKPIYFNIDKMPHLLIAGATGMGKSVCINSIIVSILYKAKPDEVKLILVDPKKVEFNVYKEMPHLYVPVVSDPKKAAGVLATAVAEMERRFEMIEDLNVRDITSYNRIAETDPDIKPMPRIVIIIDELADLMMTAPDDVETAICRLAQKARASGIHLIIGTQRPSVDVITGLIKANIPSRIAFTVASQVDSRTILDVAGAEKLIGRGDMLFAPVGAAKAIRVQGAYVGEVEVENIVEYLKTHNNTAEYDDEFVKRIEEEAAKCGNKKGAGSAAANIEDIGGDGNDPKLREAIELAIETGKISTSLMQRRLEVGYGRAAKIIDQMEQLGYVSAADGNKPRKVLITKEQFMEKVINNNV